MKSELPVTDAVTRMCVKLIFATEYLEKEANKILDQIVEDLGPFWKEVEGDKS